MKMFERKLPSQYRSRVATLDEWLGYDAERVTKVLALLSRAFRLSMTDCLRLRPDDQVWALYCSYYPSTGWRGWIGWPGSDELEMETLLRDLKAAALPGRTIELRPAVTIAELVKLLE